MVTPLLFNSNMIFLSLHPVPKHLTPATTLISVEKATMCRAHSRCLISYVGSELVTGRNVQHSEMGCRFELLKCVAGFTPFLYTVLPGPLRVRPFVMVPLPCSTNAQRP